MSSTAHDSALLNSTDFLVEPVIFPRVVRLSQVVSKHAESSQLSVIRTDAKSLYVELYRRIAAPLASRPINPFFVNLSTFITGMPPCKP